MSWLRMVSSAFLSMRKSTASMLAFWVATWRGVSPLLFFAFRERLPSMRYCMTSTWSLLAAAWSRVLPLLSFTLMDKLKPMMSAFRLSKSPSYANICGSRLAPNSISSTLASFDFLFFLQALRWVIKLFDWIWAFPSPWLDAIAILNDKSESYHYSRSVHVTTLWILIPHLDKGETLTIHFPWIWQIIFIILQLSASLNVGWR